SAAMYLDDDPGVLVSACLFGDGAGAAVLSGSPSSGRRRIRWQDSESLLDPARREALMFEQRGGMLRNVLTRPVPQLAATYACQVLETVLRRAGLDVSRIAAWIMHAGGRDVLHALEERLQLPPRELRHSAAMLREYGNLSSAFVYFVLQAALAGGAAGGWWWLGTFGAGFSSHGALLRVD
ncbi:MAG TPA: 3-oxoacyl-[acyl-carrier-protein] synthase III C-terminal domain-containing protein, partial [Steroidobacteraceae bacterium]|nr:3-oxoacyl-[acyl-carrier-protein] synthase III C-terminal domain-containing protein [Steroidobacteraceae bacterium]